MFDRTRLDLQHALTACFTGESLMTVDTWNALCMNLYIGYETDSMSSKGKQGNCIPLNVFKWCRGWRMDLFVFLSNLCELNRSA